MTVTLDFRHEKDKVRQATRRRVDAVVDAKSLTPTQRELIVLLAVVPLFRYSAGLVPWSASELEDLTSECFRGVPTPRSFDSAGAEADVDAPRPWEYGSQKPRA